MIVGGERVEPCASLSPFAGAQEMYHSASGFRERLAKLRRRARLRVRVQHGAITEREGLGARTFISRLGRHNVASLRRDWSDLGRRSTASESHIRVGFFEFCRHAADSGKDAESRKLSSTERQSSWFENNS